MTDTLQQSPSASSPEPTVKRRTATRFAVGVAVAVVVVVVTIGIALSRGATPADAQELASIQRACQQWTGAYTSSAGRGPTAAWCASMTDWMRQQLSSGHMTGHVMWSNPSIMGSTCRQWMATGSSATLGINPQACDQMVTWMIQHVDNWDTWMMSGHMMGQ
jgi:hypothetical protein